MIAEAFNKLKKQIIKPTEVENEWTPPAKLKISKTVYPNGKPQISPNGDWEWYGINETIK